MLRITSRLILGVMVALQSVQPALACNCGGSESVTYFETQYVEVGSSYSTDFCECAACAPVVESTVEFEDSCGCGVEATEEPVSEPVPAETKKQESADAKAVTTPTPSLEATEGELPPAPINVPSNPAAASSTDELFPGPAGTESETTGTPAATPAAPSTVNEPVVTSPAETQTPESSSTGTEGLFDEPSTSTPPATTPATDTEEVPFVETPSSNESSSSTDDLFTEPSQSTDEPSTTETDPAVTDSTETEATETESQSTESESEPTESEGNPLDELFGPSTTTEEPKTEEPKEESSEDTESNDAEPMEVFDPFSKLDQPRELRSWTNRTAANHTEGRLVQMNAAGVVVAQVSGRLVSLTFSQLSDADLEFVRDCVRIERAQLAAEAAGARVASK